MQSTQLQKDRYAAKTLPELEAIAAKYGFSKGWAYYVFNSNKRKTK